MKKAVRTIREVYIYPRNWYEREKSDTKVIQKWYKRDTNAFRFRIRMMKFVFFNNLSKSETRTNVIQWWDFGEKVAYFSVHLVDAFFDKFDVFAACSNDLFLGLSPCRCTVAPLWTGGFPTFRSKWRVQKLKLVISMKNSGYLTSNLKIWRLRDHLFKYCWKKSCSQF